MSKFTPGPWEWMSEYAGPENEFGCATPGVIDPGSFESDNSYSGNPELWGNGIRVISAGGGEYMPYSSPADARLIAAAPELYEALSVLCNSIETTGSPWLGSSMHNMARAALAKAKGEQP